MSSEIFGNLKEFTVSELAGAVRRVVEDGFGFVRVRGEIGRVTRHANGHIYLDLKDADASIAGVVWRNAATRLAVAPEQGMEVLVTGRLTTFAAQSKYQIVIDSLEPAGAGALMALLEERKRKLAAEGLFAIERKKPIPFLPEVIGVVTSPTGAVIRDILHRLRERFPRHVLVWPTPVQGRGAEAKIAAAIDGFNALPERGDVPRPDVLIVARGGGSLEDLWCFNEEIVARAAAASRIPLISAVGHETDTTLIDFAADLRAPTPTAAAEKAVPVRDELLRDLLGKERRLIGARVRGLDDRRTRLIAAARGLGRPEDLLGQKIQRLDRAADRLRAAMRGLVGDAALGLGRIGGWLTRSTLSTGFGARRLLLQQTQARLAAAGMRSLETARRGFAGSRLSSAGLARRANESARDVARIALRLRPAVQRQLDVKAAALAGAAGLLRSVSYERVLERGFALIIGPDQKLVSRAGAAAPGSHVGIRFSDGTVGATLDGVTPKGRKSKGSGAPSGGEAGQDSLFD
jgi:exodeoxyribonuclease VII large subunit